MRHNGITRSVIGGASAVVAVSVGAPGHAAAAATARFSQIVAIKAPPTGEYIPAFFTGNGTTRDPAVSRTSKRINGLAIPKLIHEALQAQSANIHTITGATYTSRAFKRSLASAILELGQSQTATTVDGRTYPVKDPQFTCTGCPSSQQARYGVIKLEVQT